MTTGSPLRYGPSSPARAVTLTTSDNQRLRLRVLREATDASAPPVFFVHALAMNGDMWASIADALASRVPQHGALIAMDCRGHGGSGAPEGVYTTERFALDIGEAASSEGADRFHLVGCSMGGTVALAFASRWPERLASLTVIDATAWYGTEAPANWEGRAQAALDGGMAALVEFQRARWFSPQFLLDASGLVDQAVNVFTANRVPAYASTCRMLGRADEREGLAAYTGPVAVVVGEHDYATPVAMAEDVAGRMSGAVLTVITGTRHYTPLEAPDRVAASIAQVMQRAG